MLRVKHFDAGHDALTDGHQCRLTSIVHTLKKKKTNGAWVGGTLVENVKLADKIHKRIIGNLVPVSFDN